ncbi:hypothetical protein M9194_15640 [Vibrio sp. S4M6]|uniref:hypothetical protein n=1 Tax=Vibrio sinus TaxID=2946865 RepID=UPI00202A301D|nr:hypothetical protein [Vibrio sinus]MCL9782865.1 hypothetical protein [Vibrio sinus]
MVKRFCKMNRQEISSSLGQIHQLVSAPKYICRACIRTSSYKGSLCKPNLISTENIAPASPPAHQSTQSIRQTLNSSTVSDKTLVVSECLPTSDGTESNEITKKKSKKLKKKLAKQSKQLKKLKKLGKKQDKLRKKHEKIRRKIQRVDSQLTTGLVQTKDTIERPLVH